MQDFVWNLAFCALKTKNRIKIKVLEKELAKTHCEKIVKVLTFA